MTAEQMAVLASEGRYWWMRSDGTFYATDDRRSGSDGDVYLLDASPNWVSQWEGDWSRAVEHLAPLLSKLSEHEGNTP